MPQLPLLSILALALLTTACQYEPDPSTALAERADLVRYVAARAAEGDDVAADRRAELQELAEARLESLDDGEARLTFVCTHNSRRSQMAQVWAQIAAAHFDVENVAVFSGGTQATAFHPHAVAALERAGLEIARTDETQNPVYEVLVGRNANLACWSKKFDSPDNPSDEFIAVMTCSEADRSCPFVPGARRRIAITYEDPKAFDETPREQEAYDERCAQIAREMLLTFRLVSEG